MIQVPVLPNSPLASADQKMPLGDFRLRRNMANDFVENVLFDPSLIDYDGDYQNDQSNSVHFANHMDEMYRQVSKHFPSGGKLVEVGCGKGKFLEIVRADGLFSYRGFDSAYQGDDPNVQARYLRPEERHEADILVLRHTLEHIARPHHFLEMLNGIFGDHCLVFIEVPNFSWTVQHSVIFDLTYEHVNYFSQESLARLFNQTVDHQVCFGGQYQFVLASLGSLRDEFSTEYDRSQEWAEFEFQPFLELISRAARDIGNHARTWVWGGATKGVLFLHHLKSVDPSAFSRVHGLVDINPQKQNRFAPGTSLEIQAPQTIPLDSTAEDLVIVMNPNYLDEIKDWLHRHAGFAGRVMAI